MHQAPVVSLLLVFLPAAAWSAGVPAANPVPAAVIPDYSATERKDVPDAFKFRVADLFADQEAWLKEKAAVSGLVDSVPRAAAGWTASAGSMLGLLDLLADIRERAERLQAYARLQNDMDLANPLYTAMQGEIQTMMVKFAERAAFVGPDVLALGGEKVEAFLKQEPRLEPHRFGLSKILRKREHILPEAEGAVVAKVGLFANTGVKVSGLFRDVEMPNPEVTLSDGSKVTLNQANFLIHRIAKKQEDRRTVVETFWDNYRNYQATYAALLDGEVRKQVAMARIHRHQTVLEASLFEDDIRPEVYRNLIRTVKGRLAPFHRLIRLKQKMLGLREMHYYDVPAVAAPVVEKLYPFEEARDLVVGAMAPLGPGYTQPLRQAFDGRWIDVYPNKGKQSGAYSMGIYGVHPFVKMNYLGRYSDVSTLAHELGHAMHTHFACAAQPRTTAGYAIFIAEIASTFNENLLLQRVLASGADDRTKLGLLEGYLERMRGTIYFQTMLAEFELAFHERVEEGQTLTAEWLNGKYLALYREYFGADQGVLTVDETTAVAWAAVPHFYRPYYVFQYATGMVASTALAEAVAGEGEPAAERYLGVLRAGGSKFPLDILKDAGLDMSRPEPVEAAIRQFDRLVGEMEAIHARLPQGPQGER